MLRRTPLLVLALVAALVVAVLVALRDDPTPVAQEPRRAPTGLPTPDPVPTIPPDIEPDPVPRKPLRVGISPGFSILSASDDELRTDLTAATRLGVDRVRIDLNWAKVAQYGGLDWSDTDRVVRASRAAGLKVLVVVSYSPVSGRLDDGSPDPALFGRFVAAAAQRYRDQVFAWELWNGPNRESFWAAPPDAREYARLVEAAARPLRRYDPGARILVGSLAPAVNGAVGLQVNPVTFLRRFYATGIDRGLFDVVSVHPYTYPALPSGRQPWNTYARLLDLYKVMERAGDGDKPVWLTEYGASTGASARSVSLARQEQMVLGAVREARRLPFVDSLWFYALRDTDSDSSDPETGFGLLDDAGRPKPAYSALRRELQRN
ncbi:cellulase family glycosylhydrolase [Nocardioides rubriscoriae]|uniref:cellulase family glycosylhydrolase n=1 Tax=Nocardioides rubriscoriae TaxID=642762 RepID=UPI0011E05A89|nr:cellulase family glycosylhydrolase [Nocardioides rubriscoriae]